MIPILFLVLALIQPQTFAFQSQGKSIEGILSLPSGQPKALVLYFHRSIEDRSAVTTWGDLLKKDGYAVAGYTADHRLDANREAADALNALLKRKQFVSVPVIAMGASMGTPAAAQLFAEDQRVKTLILIVPASHSVCESVKKAGDRHVFLIQAENDEVAGSMARTIRNCMPGSAGTFVLKGASHRFPPSAVSSQILQWINTMRSEFRQD